MHNEDKKPMGDPSDILTLIMGVAPDEPGQHGRLECPMPDKDAIGTITQIRDLCEQFLLAADKGKGKEEKGGKEKPMPKGKDEKPEEEPEEEEEEE